MRKLHQLRRWLSLPDAAQYLSDSFGEPVTQADVLRLALDGELTLSVHFVNNAKATRGKAIPLAAAVRRVMPALNGDGVVTHFNGTVVPGERVLQFDDNIVTLSGVWDLTMFGAEELDVESLYQTLTSGPSVDLLGLDGVFVTDGQETFCRLMSRYSAALGRSNTPDVPHNHSSNYFPSGMLPDGSVFVVRISALRALEDRLAQVDMAGAVSAERPVARRERSTLLMMIAALAEIAKVDVMHPSKAATAIESQTERMGARVAARTIENHLKLIPETLESRTQ